MNCSERLPDVDFSQTNLMPTTWVFGHKYIKIGEMLRRSSGFMEN